MLPELDKFSLQNKVGDGQLCIAQGKNLLDLILDMNVYLPTKAMNLQRPFKWTLQQQCNFIESIIVRRPIHPVSVILKTNDIYEVIDGKQRLTTLIRYLQGKFKFCNYAYQDLPPIYQGQIDRFFIRAYCLNEEYNTPVSDETKIDWFKMTFLHFFSVCLT
jgi:hypothetical protein